MRFLVYQNIYVCHSCNISSLVSIQSYPNLLLDWMQVYSMFVYQLTSNPLFIFSWLYKNSTVLSITDGEDGQSYLVETIIDTAAYGKFKHLFSVNKRKH